MVSFGVHISLNTDIHFAFIFLAFLFQWWQIKNLLGLSSKVLCLTVNQRAAGETATQAVNNACARGGGGGDTIDIALPLPPQLTPLQSTPLQSTLRYHRRLRSAADDTATPHNHAAAAADGCCSAQRITPGLARGLARDASESWRYCGRTAPARRAIGGSWPTTSRRPARGRASGELALRPPGERTASPVASSTSVMTAGARIHRATSVDAAFPPPRSSGLTFVRARRSSARADWCTER